MKPNLCPLEITGSSRLVFILGRPLGHSLSPLMHNAAFRKLKMPWIYAPLEISGGQVAAALEVLRGSNVRGANVTVPYKKDVIAYLDNLEPEAEWLGSVNTVYRKGSKLCGASTDGEGFLRSLGRWRKKLRNSRGLLVGAGGAARAVAGALARSGINRLTIANRTPGRAEDLARSLQRNFRRLETGVLSPAGAEKILSHFNWIVQATSLGLGKGEAAPLSLKKAQPTTWVVDLIYHRETDFLREARALGLPRMNGVGMLLHQGALSFERWTGQKAPLKVMRDALAHGRLPP